ncbi:MAG: DNA polymerase III subunit alpha [Acidimicrobiia bacterium]
MGFVHLHTHSAFSFREGAIRPDELAQAAARAGMGAVALTDHLGVSAAVRFTEACRSAGVRPILGAEVPVAAPVPATRPSGGRGRPGTPDLLGGNHTVVIARTEAGWANLCRLLTALHLPDDPGLRIEEPEIPWEVFCRHSGGLTVLSGCDRGEVSRHLARGDRAGALATVLRYREVCDPGAFAVEVSHHLRPEDPLRIDAALAVAASAGVPAVATNDVHYLDRRDAALHELLVAMRDLVPLAPTRQRRSTAEYDFVSERTMRDRFAGVEEVVDATVALAEACEFELDLDNHHLPEVEANATIARLCETASGRLGGAGRTELLTRACEAGLARRMPGAGAGVHERLAHEIEVIARLGFSGYFLMAAEICAHIVEMGIRVACRGSAAGSLVTYVLGIGDVDPVAHDLCFARFVNEHRRTLPDIDLDVESHRRDEVLAWIMDRYGHERTAMVAAVDTYRARSAIREVGAAFGFPPSEVDTLAKYFPHVGAAGIEAALAELPELRDVHLDDVHVRRLFSACAAIDGFPRGLSVHPCGVLIGPADFRDRVPLEASPQGLPLAQFDKDDVDALGLVKLDVLGVRMQSTIAHAVAEIARTEPGGGPPDPGPGGSGGDEATYELIRSTHTLGCFQIESPGQRELLGRLAPDRFADLVVDISLFRPGPVKADMVGPFVDRRHGVEAEVYASPVLAPILGETHGVIVFHEQVIRTIAVLGGVDEAEADAIRRRLGDPGDPDTIAVGRWLCERAVDLGLDEAEAEAVWAQVASFASFGFCKAHAAAFAVPTYLSAWLKAHHPAAFLAGVLTHDPGMYPRRVFVHEAARFGVAVLPVDVNVSDVDDRVDAVPDTRRESGEEDHPAASAGSMWNVNMRRGSMHA